MALEERGFLYTPKVSLKKGGPNVESTKLFLGETKCEVTPVSEMKATI